MEWNSEILELNAPISVKGHITTDTEEELKIIFPKIDQKYSIDIHPLDE